MSYTRSKEMVRRWTIAVLAVIGLLLVLMAVGAIPTNPGSARAPGWVLGICAAIVWGIALVALKRSAGQVRG